MIDQVDLLKFAAYAARGIPPQRFGWWVFEYGGVISLPGAQWPAAVAPDIKGGLLDAVLEHAKARRNAVLIAWLHEKPLALWRFLPPRIRRRIIIIDEWDKYRESKDKVFAVAWISTGCCRAVAWSYPYVALKVKKMKYVPPALW
jgi:hypothetical protein